MIKRIFISVCLVFAIGHAQAQTKTTVVQKAAPVKKVATQPAKKPQPVRVDKLYKLDGVSVLRGKVLKVSTDSVSYIPLSAKVKKTIALSDLEKIVFANGSVRLIEVREPEVAAAKAEEVKENILPKKKEIAPVEAKEPVLDEIILKNGQVITGRIVSQQKFKVGYRAAPNLDSGVEQFITITKIRKLKYGANGQEVVLNPVKEKPVKSQKPEKAITESSADRTEKIAEEKVFKPFKVDVTAGYSRFMDGDADISFGFNFSVEPKYNVTDNIAAGFKIEAAAFIFSDQDVSSFLLMKSYSLTGEYLLSKKKARPYFGLAIGLYQPVGYVVEDEVFKTKLDKCIGFAPRAGIHLGRFRLGAEFNVVKDNKSDINYSFLSIKIGATIGGGRIRR